MTNPTPQNLAQHIPASFICRLHAVGNQKRRSARMVCDNPQRSRTLLIAQSEAVDLSDPAQNAAYVANRDGGRAAARAAIDGALTRLTHHAYGTTALIVVAIGLIVFGAYSIADARYRKI